VSTDKSPQDAGPVAKQGLQRKKQGNHKKAEGRGQQDRLTMDSGQSWELKQANEKEDPSPRGPTPKPQNQQVLSPNERKRPWRPPTLALHADEQGWCSN
jgi:hypothetical protein